MTWSDCPSPPHPAHRPVLPSTAVLRCLCCRPPACSPPLLFMVSVLYGSVPVLWQKVDRRGREQQQQEAVAVSAAETGCIPMTRALRQAACEEMGMSYSELEDKC